MAVTVNSEPIDRLVDEILNPIHTSSAVAEAGVFAAPKATLAPVPLFSPVTSGITLVVPARNEARNLPVVLESIPDFVDDVILVDENSGDATVTTATYCRSDIRMIYQESPGKAAALCAGFLAAQGDIIVMMDADGSLSDQ